MWCGLKTNYLLWSKQKTAHSAPEEKLQEEEILLLSEELARVSTQPDSFMSDHELRWFDDLIQ